MRYLTNIDLRSKILLLALFGLLFLIPFISYFPVSAYPVLDTQASYIYTQYYDPCFDYYGNYIC